MKKRSQSVNVKHRKISFGGFQTETIGISVKKILIEVPRNYLFPGAGRKIGKERFIVMEDVPHAHAGDLRHRLWSDGTIDFYYSWETQGDPR